MPPAWGGLVKGAEGVGFVNMSCWLGVVIGVLAGSASGVFCGFCMELFWGLHIGLFWGLRIGFFGGSGLFFWGAPHCFFWGAPPPAHVRLPRSLFGKVKPGKGPGAWI